VAVLTGGGGAGIVVGREGRWENDVVTRSAKKAPMPRRSVSFMAIAKTLEP